MQFTAPSTHGEQLFAMQDTKREKTQLIIGVVAIETKKGGTPRGIRLIQGTI